MPIRTVNGLPRRKRLLSLLKKFPQKRILVLGDLMLDRFIRGKVGRISPEAPVPVVAVSTESHAPGGAGNVCNNLAALGARVSIHSVLGKDAAGSFLLSDLQARGIDTQGILLDPSRVTTEKCRIIAQHQQVVRVDREQAHGFSPVQQSALLARLERDVPKAHALVISDYGKGIVTERTLRSAIHFARCSGIPVLVDPKEEHFKRYKGVDCITPNLHEAWGGMRLHPSQREDAILDLGQKILKALKVRSLLITRGEKGMTLFQNTRPEAVCHIPTQAKEVFDVTGAGDTVISVMALALACKASFEDAAVASNLAAGIVVGKLGTATVSVQEMEAALRARQS